MKVLVRFGTLVLVVALLVAACNMGLGTFSQKAPALPSEGSVEPQTGAAVSIPAISTRLLSALNAEYAASSSGAVSSQAILFATAVDLELFQGGESRQTWHISDADEGLTIIGDDGPPRLEAFLEIDAGTGYTLTATVYNSKAGPDPVVEGTSDSFTIVAGVSTPVPIIGIPVSPIDLGTGHDSSADLSIAQTPYQFGAGGEEDPDLQFTGFGGEAWFQLHLTGAENAYARLRADPAGAADAIMLVYDEDGRLEEEMADPPPWSWGFFPDAIGGRGGTRAGLMGPLDGEGDISPYIGLILMNRSEATTSESVSVQLDILDRPAEAYTNALPVSAEPDLADYLEHAVGSEQTQTVFRSAEAGTEGEPMVHWFLLDGIGWNSPDLMNPLPVTVTATFDLLESGHLQGIAGYRGEGMDEIEHPMLTLLVGDSAGINPPSPDIYVALNDTGFVVTENLDGSTTVQFVVDVDTTGNRDTAVIGVSSRYPGNRFTLSWNAPGGAEVGVE